MLAASSLLCVVAAEKTPDWNNILTVGAGPTYNKYFNKAQSQPRAAVKKTKKKKPSTKKKKDDDVNPYGPMPELPTPMINDGLLGMVEDGMGMNDDVMKAAIGIGLGLLAVPLIGSGSGGDKALKQKQKQETVPPPPPPPPQIMAAPSKQRSSKSLKLPSLKFPSLNIVPNGNDPALRNSVINLIKNIVGLSVLALPSGISSYGSSKNAVVSGLVVIAIMGSLSGYSFNLIGKVCDMTNSKSYKDAWSKSIGESTSIIPNLAIIAQTTLTCIAITLVLSDTLSTLLDISNGASLVGITLLGLLPLCLQGGNNLGPLSKYSLVGILGVIITGISMTTRLLDGSYDMPVVSISDVKKTSSAQLSGFVSEIPKFSRPSFGKLGMMNIFESTNSFILLSILSTAFMVSLKRLSGLLELIACNKCDGPFPHEASSV